MNKRRSYSNRQIATPQLDLSWVDVANPEHVRIAIEELSSLLQYLSGELARVERIVKCSSTSTEVIVIPPSIVVQPTDQTVTAGGTATFTTEVDGEPFPTVQWESREDGTEFTAPTFSENDFGPLYYPTALPYNVTYSGATMVLNDIVGDNFVALDYIGKPRYLRTVVEYNYATSPASDAQFFLNLLTEYSAPATDRIQIARGEVSLGGSSELIIETIIGGVSTKTSLGNFEKMTNVITELIMNDDLSMDYTLTMTGQSATVYSESGTIQNAYVKSSDYIWWVLGREYSATITSFDIKGIGYPSASSEPFSDITGETGQTLTRTNIGTTGDPFGTEYQLTATNSAGSATTNTVTTIEA